MSGNVADLSPRIGNMTIHPRIDPSSYTAQPAYYQGEAPMEIRQPIAPIMGGPPMMAVPSASVLPSSPPHSIGNNVKLNIGGTIFQTSKSTLTKFDGFFKTILETGVPMPKDDSGAIFIDRDPKYFPQILNFMRNGDVATPPSSSEEILEFIKEAQFYLMPSLVNLLNTELEKMKQKKNQLVERQAPTNVIKLNIGGTVFHTTRATLVKQRGLFKQIVKGKTAAKIDDAGCICIDRKPENFQKFLKFMETGLIDFPDDRKQMKKLFNDAEFYKFEGLAAELMRVRVVRFGQRFGLMKDME